MNKNRFKIQRSWFGRSTEKFSRVIAVWTVWFICSWINHKRLLFPGAWLATMHVGCTVWITSGLDDSCFCFLTCLGHRAVYDQARRWNDSEGPLLLGLGDFKLVMICYRNTQPSHWFSTITNEGHCCWQVISEVKHDVYGTKQDDISFSLKHGETWFN